MVHEIAKQTQFVHMGIAILGILALGNAVEGVRFRSALRKGSAIVAVILITVGAIWITTPATPNASVFNGKYRNLCCEALTIRDGVLMTRNQRVPFKLELQKWGLAAALDVPVEVRNGQVIAAPDASTSELTFTDDLKTIIICGQPDCGVGHEYQFDRFDPS